MIGTNPKISEAPRVVVGLMSGTSADAIDVAVCEFQGERPDFRLIRHGERPLSSSIQERVRAAARLGVREVAELGIAVAECFARACMEVAEEAGLRLSEVAAIGSHGQTLYHHGGTPDARRATLQVGDGDRIAEVTGCLVVSDFRARDIAAGGEGAPLTPLADAVFFGDGLDDSTGRRAVLNLGGIANVTILGPAPDQIVGFDTGPANAPLDRLARRLTGGRLDYDTDGLIALSGTTDEALLADLLRTDDFRRRKPPKSTGFEVYGDDFLDAAAARHGGHDADLMATLVGFAAELIAEALRLHIPEGPPLTELIVAGGGLRNPALRGRIEALVSPVTVVASDDRGVPSDAREAMAFALLADRAIRGVASPLSSVTGAAGPRILGKISLP